MVILSRLILCLFLFVCLSFYNVSGYNFGYRPDSSLTPGGILPPSAPKQHDYGYESLATGLEYQYGWIIDAGSTGSRISLYRWHPRERTIRLDPHSAEIPSPEPPFSRPMTESSTIFKVRGGLHGNIASSAIYAKNTPSGMSYTTITGQDIPTILHDSLILSTPAASLGSVESKTRILYSKDLLLAHVDEYLGPLVQFAYNTMTRLGIEDRIPITPLYLTATGGVRSLPDSERDLLMECVQLSLYQSGFLFKKEWASVISGEMEGFYGWVSVNYLLSESKLFSNSTNNFKPVATVDLGGATMQIALAQNATSLLSGFNFNIAASNTNVFVQCFWYFGKDIALWRLHNILYSASFSHEIYNHYDNHDNITNNIYIDDKHGDKHKHNNDNNSIMIKNKAIKESIDKKASDLIRGGTQNLIPHRPADPSVIPDDLELVLLDSSSTTTRKNPHSLDELDDLTIAHDNDKKNKKQSQSQNRDSSKSSSIPNNNLIGRPDGHDDPQQRIANNNSNNSRLWLDRNLPHNWHLQVNSTRIHHNNNDNKSNNDNNNDDIDNVKNTYNTPHIHKTRVFSSPCLPSHFSMDFTPFDKHTLTLIGSPDWESCYSLARQLVISRTTAPCFNTFEDMDSSRTTTNNNNNNNTNDNTNTNSNNSTFTNQILSSSTSSTSKSNSTSSSSSPSSSSTSSSLYISPEIADLIAKDSQALSSSSLKSPIASLSSASHAQSGSTTHVASGTGPEPVPFSGQCTSFYGQYRPSYEGRAFYAFSGFYHFPSFLAEYIAKKQGHDNNSINSKTSRHTVTGLSTPRKESIDEYHTGYAFTLYEIREYGKEICSIPFNELQQQWPNMGTYMLRNMCWLSVYSVALLHDGLRLPLNSPEELHQKKDQKDGDNNILRFVQRIDDVDVTYVPGAMLYLVNQLPYDLKYNTRDLVNDFSIQSSSFMHNNNNNTNVTMPWLLISNIILALALGALGMYVYFTHMCNNNRRFNNDHDITDAPSSLSHPRYGALHSSDQPAEHTPLMQKSHD